MVSLRALALFDTDQGLSPQCAIVLTFARETQPLSHIYAWFRCIMASYRRLYGGAAMGMAPIFLTQFGSTISVLTEYADQIKAAQVKAKEPETETVTGSITSQGPRYVEGSPTTPQRPRVGSQPAPAPGKAKKAKKAPQPPPAIAPAAHVVIMQILVSIIALAAGIYFIVTAKSNIQALAAGWVGLVIGYWLR